MKSVFKVIVLCLCLLSAASQAWAYDTQKDKVKVAVASTGKTAAASVSNMAARSPYYLIFDGTGNLIEVISNPHQDTTRGAGTSVANFFAAKGVTIVIAENFGTKIINALEGKHISHFEFKGYVDAAVSKVLELKQRVERNVAQKL